MRSICVFSGTHGVKEHRAFALQEGQKLNETYSFRKCVNVQLRKQERLGNQGKQ